MHLPASALAHVKSADGRSPVKVSIVCNAVSTEQEALRSRKLCTGVGEVNCSLVNQGVRDGQSLDKLLSDSIWCCVMQLVATAAMVKHNQWQQEVKHDCLSEVHGLSKKGFGTGTTPGS